MRLNHIGVLLFLFKTIAGVGLAAEATPTPAAGRTAAPKGYSKLFPSGPVTPVPTTEPVVEEKTKNVQDSRWVKPDPATVKDAPNSDGKGGLEAICTDIHGVKFGLNDVGYANCLDQVSANANRPKDPTGIRPTPGANPGVGAGFEYKVGK